MIDLIIFEDDVTPFGKDINDEVLNDFAAVLYGTEEKVEWHAEWNALGNYAKSLGKRSVKMDTDKAFGEALNWCLTADTRSIIICDYHFLNVTVQEEQVARVGDAALAVTGKTTVEEATEYFNTEAHGLLLVAALAMNLRADVDVWLATGIHTEPDVNRERISPFVRATFWVGIAFNAVTRGQSKGQPVESVKRAVSGYFKRRQLADPGFWPDYAVTWFSDDEQPAPHRHGRFQEYFRNRLAEPSPVSYLRSLGASTAVTDKWLSEEGCYESLKRFLGACALVHASEAKDHELRLGSLVVVLLKATAPAEWAEDFSWEAAPFRPIMSPDRGASKRLVLACYKLFRTLHRAQNGEGTNLVRAEFQKKEPDGIHLMIDFQFDCSIGRSASKPSLLAKVLALSQHPASGDSTEAFSAVLEASLDKQHERQLFMALYPVSHEGSVWTRLDFKANS